MSTISSAFLNIGKWFTKTREPKISTKTGGGMKAFMSKLSGAFLLPISVLAIAGLFLGIGATIAGNANGNQAVITFGNFIKQLGDPLFGALPLLFAAAIAVSFTEEAGVAVFNAIVGYLIFSALQSVFIEPVNIVDPTNPDKKILLGYKILFGGGWREYDDLKNLVGTTLGFSVMQTSVFGGIVVGFLVQWVYNRFHKIQLPQIISFFGGKRFVALAVVVFMIPVVFAFLLLWPYIGYIFNWIGKNSGKIPYGFDSFIFGFIERALVPFGLHHVFYSPLWYTSAGGDVSVELNTWLNQAGNEIKAADLKSIIEALKGEFKYTGSLDTYVNLINNKDLFEAGSVNGDSTTTLALLGVNTNTVSYKVNGVSKSLPLFEFIQKELGLKLGRFLDGKFSFMQWGLPAAAAAMIMAAPKENRKVALGTIFPAALTCFITGVTEPIEFTFLFLAPALFFGFHALMCAISFLMANLLSVHIGMAFSGGFLDLVVYGMIPVLKGTNFWWTIVVGLPYIPIYYFVFYFWIKKADLPTPGRGGNTKLFTKKDYQASKENSTSTTNGIEPQVINVINGFGGRNNIVKTANCATRLRFDVKDMQLVNEDQLKASGAFGLRKISDTHLQVIFGPIADQLRIKIDNAINQIDKDPSILQNLNSLNSQVSEKTHTTQLKQIKDVNIHSPANGKLKPLSSLNDGVFSENMLGQGFVIESNDGNIYSPVDGTITVVFPTKHAYGIETDDGLNILIHIGIDTVSLNGKGFKSLVEQGQKVKQGKLIAKYDVEKVKQHNLISDVICLITPDSQIQPNVSITKAKNNITKDNTIIK